MITATVKGTCNHHDFAGVGAALPDSLNRFRVSTLQDWGVTAWRMSHNPPAPELLDMTDEAGMLVWDEIRHFGDFGLWRKEARDTILRDRNHPSIMVYSLCNVLLRKLADPLTSSRAIGPAADETNLRRKVRFTVWLPGVLECYQVCPTRRLFQQRWRRCSH